MTPEEKQIPSSTVITFLTEHHGALSAAIMSHSAKFQSSLTYNAFPVFVSYLWSTTLPRKTFKLRPKYLLFSFPVSYQKDGGQIITSTVQWAKVMFLKRRLSAELHHWLGKCQMLMPENVIQNSWRSLTLNFIGIFTIREWWGPNDAFSCIEEIPQRDASVTKCTHVKKCNTPTPLRHNLSVPFGAEWASGQKSFHLRGCRVA